MEHVDVPICWVMVNMTMTDAIFGGCRFTKHMVNMNDDDELDLGYTISE